MPYRIETYYREAGLFMPTNHKSDDLDELKALANSEIFTGFRIRIADQDGQVFYEPPVRERDSDLSIQDIASMLDVPVIQPDELDGFLGGGDPDA
jgi:hypothetical protein